MLGLGMSGCGYVQVSGGMLTPRHETSGGEYVWQLLCPGGEGVCPEGEYVQGTSSTVQTWDFRGGYVQGGPPHPRDMVDKRAVRIQLECFLVSSAGIICQLSAAQQDDSARTFAHLAAIVRITER